MASMRQDIEQKIYEMEAEMARFENELAQSRPSPGFVSGVLTRTMAPLPAPPLPPVVAASALFSAASNMVLTQSLPAMMQAQMRPPTFVPLQVKRALTVAPSDMFVKGPGLATVSTQSNQLMIHQQQQAIASSVLAKMAGPVVTDLRPNLIPMNRQPPVQTNQQALGGPSMPPMTSTQRNIPRFTFNTPPPSVQLTHPSHMAASNMTFTNPPMRPPHPPQNMPPPNQQIGPQAPIHLLQADKQKSSARPPMNGEAGPIRPMNHPPPTMEEPLKSFTVIAAAPKLYKTAKKKTKSAAKIVTKITEFKSPPVVSKPPPPVPHIHMKPPDPPVPLMDVILPPASHPRSSSPDQDSVMDVGMTMDGDPYSAAGTSGDKSRRNKKTKSKIVRMAGGQVWEDATLNEWDPDDFRIFCGDLGNEVTDETLAKVFSKYMSFVKARVVREKRTNKSKGYGFVSFRDPQDYIRAMKEMNGKYVGNRPIKLRKSSWRDRNIEAVKKKLKEKKRLGFR